MVIKITKIPSGFPPEEIRKAWVGIELECQKDENVKVLGLAVDPKEPEIGLKACVKNIDGFTVTYKEILTKLKVHNKKAHDWWIREFGTNAFPDGLVFKKEFCQIIK